MAVYRVSKSVFCDFINKFFCPLYLKNYSTYQALRSHRLLHTSFILKEESAGEVSVKDASKDRTKVIPVETSVRYLKSSAYYTTYGEEPVWKPYRRNHKGATPPRKTRETCIRKGQISAGNPCPLCRDEYLVVHPENTELLKQFISPYTGAVLSYTTTGICQRRHRELLVAIEIAKDCGYITFDVPFRVYDYSLYK